MFEKSHLPCFYLIPVYIFTYLIMEAASPHDFESGRPYSAKYLSQQAEWILNKIGKTFNGTFAGWVSIKGSEYILFEILVERPWIHQLGSLAITAQPTSIQCLAGGFYGL